MKEYPIMSSPPSQQRAIITGASSGIGQATALAFAKAGIHVALVSRSLEKLEKVAHSCQDFGVEAKVYPLDLSEVATVKDKIVAIDTDFGGTDVLVNNAGMGYTKPLRETSLEDWQKILDLNLTSIFQCIQGILPGMRQRGQGTIVNISSVAATVAFPDWGAYSVSKAGVRMLSQALGVEERANGIRVVTIAPGAVNTPIWDTETVQADFERSMMLKPEMVAQAILQAVLMPKEAVIEEMSLMPSAGAL
jgi:short-subunit dehydrogenase